MAESPSVAASDTPALAGRLRELLGQLTLERKVLLLTGRDFWSTWPLEEIGLRSMTVSDGPSGVRGAKWDEREPSLNLPSATALSSAWSRSIAERYGAASAREARRKNVDVVLGPTINLHRSPLGGRHFEAFSEDPVLTSELSAAYVRGTQRNGVGATPKHYVANDYETERFTADTVVDERTLREVYLYAFEKSIVEEKAWLVMSAYNSINGATATENELLETPLNSEWGFDGVVISDWTAVRSLDSARFAQDLVMPGPDGPWGDALVAAVRNGDIDESVINRKVLRILGLAARVGAIEGIEPVAARPVDTEDGLAFAREAAAAGSVLVRNEGALPLAPGSVGSLAVIGHNARQARTQGGGSATVVPEKIVTPIEGIEAAYPNAKVTYSVGAVVQEGVAELPLDRIVNPATGENGMRVVFRDAEGAELFAEDRFATSLTYFGGDAPTDRAAVIELSLRYTPEVTGPMHFGFASVGTGRIYARDELQAELSREAVGDDLGAAFLAPPSATTAIDVVEGEPIDLRIEFERGAAIEGLGSAFAITVGAEPDATDPEQLIADAVEAARAAEVAVVVVGTNAKVESEGYDRETLALPGRQDDLVRAVAAVNPRTIVVVNSGAPVELPWRDEVAAVLLTYFAGQEFGSALGDMLTGAVEPRGRLATTWPKAMADVPVLGVTPENGRLRYDEGIHIGYRAWLKAGTEPAYEFGFGLGYTTWSFDAIEVDGPLTEGGEASIAVTVTNTGDRAGRQVVQLYAERADSTIDRPVRWLVGFGEAQLEAGASGTVTIPLPARALAHWADGWQYETGEFTLRAGSSVTALPLEASIQLS